MFFGLRYDRETGRITGVYEAESLEDLHMQVREGAFDGLLITTERLDFSHHFVVRNGMLTRKVRVEITLPDALRVGEVMALRAVPEHEGPPLHSASFQMNGRAARLEAVGRHEWRTVLLYPGTLRLWVDDAHYYSDPVTAVVR